MIENLLEIAVQQAQLDGDPLPNENALQVAREVYQALTAGGLDANDLTHDSLGGISIFVGNATAHAWVSIRNDVPPRVLFSGVVSPSTIPIDKGFVEKISKYLLGGESSSFSDWFTL